MPISRRPYLVLAVWTALAIVPAVGLNAAMTAPVAPGCFEYCELGQSFAALGLFFLSVIWLLGVLVVAWRWRDKERSIAAISALAAIPFLLIMAAPLFRFVSFDVVTEHHVQLAWLLGFGLQLPPVWRLAKRTPPSTPLRIVVAVMNLAVAAVATSIFLFGRNFLFSEGPLLNAVAWWTFAIGLLILSIAAWRDGVSPPSVLAPLIGASLPILLVPVGLIAPGQIGYVIFLSVPLTAIAWLWVAVAWLRDDLGSTEPRPSSV